MKKILEKFNTTEELADAYRALESAFTKKCQELARLRDRGSDGEETAETDAQADSDAAAEAEAMRPAEQCGSESGEKPFDADAVKFFAAFPSAKETVAELAELLSAVETVDYAAMCTAYAHLLEGRICSPESLAEDEDFLAKFIYPSARVRAYFAPAETPRMIGGGLGAVAPIAKPKTFAQAATLAQQLLNR